MADREAKRELAAEIEARLGCACAGRRRSRRHPLPAARATRRSGRSTCSAPEPEGRSGSDKLRRAIARRECRGSAARSLGPNGGVFHDRFDPMYLVFLAPALLLSLWASFRTKSAFKKYSKVRVATGLTGAQAAQRMLDAAGIRDVKVVPHQGMLTDHYNPVTKTLALSEQVYGVRLDRRGRRRLPRGRPRHPARHAPTSRSGCARLLVPTANIGSTVGYLVMIFGLMSRLDAGVHCRRGALLGGAALPGGHPAGRVRRLGARQEAGAWPNGIVLPQEREGMDRVLNAAALTYVAAAISTPADAALLPLPRRPARRPQPRLSFRSRRRSLRRRRRVGRPFAVSVVSLAERRPDPMRRRRPPARRACRSLARRVRRLLPRCAAAARTAEAGAARPEVAGDHRQAARRDRRRAHLRARRQRGRRRLRDARRRPARCGTRWLGGETQAIVWDPQRAAGRSASTRSASRPPARPPALFRAAGPALSARVRPARGGDAGHAGRPAA